MKEILAQPNSDGLPAQATSSSFERFGGVCAILAGAAGLLYSVAFILLARASPSLGALLSALFLALGGLFGSAALVALYKRLIEMPETETAFAFWGLMLGLAGALGSLLHGGYDLANAINPPQANLPGLADLPSPIDPRGLLTFGIAGVSVFVFAWLMGRGKAFPTGLSRLGYLLALALAVIYLGRLVILQATSPVILIPALLAGFLLNPAWYIWLGSALLRAAP